MGRRDGGGGSDPAVHERSQAERVRTDRVRTDGVRTDAPVLATDGCARPGPGDRRHTPLALEELERQHIERTLRHHGGNRTRSAQELGISRATLINKIKRWNLDI